MNNIVFSLYYSDTQKKEDAVQREQPATPLPENSSRDVKSKAPIRESMEMVAIQLLDKPKTTSEAPVIADTRIPPKLKTQLKHKIKTRHENSEELENAHPGVAVPITIEELDTENKISNVPNESSTSNEGISTWISLSNSVRENATTELPKAEEITKKPKPAASKNKPKRPQNNKVVKRPIIGSTNKADLVASGSAINENVYNKIKDTVLSNVQKNKNTSVRPTSTTTTSTTTTTTEIPTTKKETKAPATPVITVTSKPKKKNKNKQKTSTAIAPAVINESALLPTEAKEQEIELEVSTPPTTTKKPKRSSTRKKNKKRKTSTPKPSTEVAISEVKTANKTKSNKNGKKPVVETGAITTQIYNYLSREVMPSVGVGMLGLASLVGIAGYFLYPFATPVRRTFEVDKNDDIYRNNAEEYANDGNGQAEEEMLGTVLAGMPAHAKQKLNPYAGQTAHINRYPVKKEQDIRYRHVATGYNPNPNYGKVHYAQQKTGIAHAAVYSKPINYSPQYETRHVYTTEGKFNFEKAQQPNYTPYPAVEPIYAAPQTGPSGISSYGNENSNSVVYGVKPVSESDFKPVYPFEGQFYSETTSSPVTYQPTSMYLGSNNEDENQGDAKYEEDSSATSEKGDNKFVVGNVPKELVDSATPAVVPEHGPRKLRKRRSISGSLEELLAEKESNKDIFISNEIDDVYVSNPIRNLAPSEPADVTVLPKDVTTIYAISEPAKELKTTESPTTAKSEIVESVSTLPIDNKDEKTTETEIPNETETTTKTFKVYEVFPSSNTDVTERNSPLYSPTTTFKSIMTETTTELRSETTSTMPTSVPLSTIKPSPTAKPSSDPDVITYPPLNNQQGGFFTFLQRLVDFKFRLGLGILQSTVDALNRLRDDTMQKVTNASRTHPHTG